MGLCFSSMYATLDVPTNEVNLKLPNIERNEYVFYDGIGMLTLDLAMAVSDKLQLNVYPPSTYQIRFAGCKGSLPVSLEHIMESTSP
ncbi:hypothetical protein IFM89_008342 [Coptis chinensis]|uniref:RNA-dependent RNA polymerase n=1 Tax=Coptis chinensis TaxID=261450 RepID=A0A835LZN4_9MAGN|nr:hypothetical protein IFM89_008342 [Coptis chinensis]